MFDMYVPLNTPQMNFLPSYSYLFFLIQRMIRPFTQEVKSWVINTVIILFFF